MQWLEPKLALAPVAPGVTLGAGVADGATRAEATQAAGVVTVRGESGATVYVSFVGTTGGVGDAGKIVTKSVPGMGPGVPVAVTLTDADLARITDGPAYAVAIQRDALGEWSPNAVVPFTLDTIAPTAAATLLGPGVADGATRAEATQAGGIITVSGEPTATIFISFVGTTGGVGDPGKIVTKSVTGLAGVTLTDADLARITDGPAYAVVIQRDVAGNWGPNTVVPFTLDTVAPVAPAAVLSPGIADGATAAEATQAAGAVLVSGENGATVYVSFVGTTNGVGDASKVVAKSVTGRGPGVFLAVTLTPADLLTITDGPVYAVAVQHDAAGNWSTNVVNPFSLVGVAMEFVTVGDAGNAADDTGYGAVGYAYQMGKYEVTIGQYAKFLNAVARTDTYGLYSLSMGSSLFVAGIARSGSPGSYSYTVMDNGGDSSNRPITYVSWFNAARFANWMHNGQPTGSQVAATTENGAYRLNGATSGTGPVRNLGARFVIPTEDEWYKAAYYKGGGTNAGYWEYATRSDSAPGNTIGSGINQANYTAGVAYAVTGSPTFSPVTNHLTSVGAFTNSASAYGTFDQSGNVYEWNELSGAPGSPRGSRGGSFASTSSSGLSAASRGSGFDAGTLDPYSGFRLARPA